MKEKGKHTTEFDIKSNCILIYVSMEYLQSMQAMNISAINNIFDNCNLVILQPVSKKIGHVGNQKHIINFLWPKCRIFILTL